MCCGNVCGIKPQAARLASVRQDEKVDKELKKKKKKRSLWCLTFIRDRKRKKQACHKRGWVGGWVWV